jgi:hypothetical protein
MAQAIWRPGRRGIGCSKSICTDRLPLAVLATIAELSAHLVAFHFSPECEHIAGFRAEYDVMHVDRAFNSARLVRTFEMPAELRAILLDFDVLRRSPAVGVIGVNRPLARHVVGRLFDRGLLRPRDAVDRD